ncbi:DNA topoisomerase [Yersinia phage fHe-Yen9-02]|nr:DNA topoisomerase [Yersinia phage fHe-Yen9-02]
MTVRKQLRTLDVKALVKSELACGDCRGLTRDALLPSAEKPCNTQGVLDSSKICNHFRADSFSLKEVMQEHGNELVGLFKTFASFSDKDLRVIASMLLSESRTRRQGAKMGDPIFVRYRGRETRNYINNFMACRILDVTEQEIRCVSEDGQIVLTYPNNGFTGPSVYSKADFRKLHKKMKAENKLIDPEKEIKTARRNLPDEANISFSAPSSLDGFSVPRMGDVVRGKGAKRKKTKTHTLMDIVSMIDAGHDMGSNMDEAGVTELSSDKYHSRIKRSKSGAIELSDLAD